MPEFFDIAEFTRKPNMSQDISSGDSTPKLTRASAIDIAKALNLWYKFIELADNFTTPIQFNKSGIFFGSATARNTATDFQGFKLLSTTAGAIGQLWGDEGNNATKLESNAYPLWLNASPSGSYISLRVNDVQIAQVNPTGVGIGMTAVEKLSVGTTTNGQGSAIGIYALTAAGASVASKLTQDPTSGNLTINYSTGAGGTGKYLVLSGNSGGQTYLSASGDFGLNNAGPGYSGYSNGKYLSIRGASAPGVIELMNNAVDTAGTTIGAVSATDLNSSATDKRLGALEFLTDGTTASNRGGALRLVLKPNNTNGLVEALRVNNARQVLIGVNTPLGNENVRIHNATGAKLILSDSNNLVYIASVTSSTSSEMALASNNIEAVRIDKNQQIGIATTTPTARLDIFGSAAANPQLIIARGGDINYQLVGRNGVGTNVSGDLLFQLGAEYAGVGTGLAALAAGFAFTRGGNATDTTVHIYGNASKLASFGPAGVQIPGKMINTGTMGNIGTQTNTTTAGLVIQTGSAGVVGTDGAFITFLNKDGTKAFSAGMDSDGEFKVGGGSIGTTARKIHHDGYNPGAMVLRGTVNWTDADLYRPSGFYALRNSSNSASYGLVEFADIGSSTCRIQLIGYYGGDPYASNPDELYFRTARDTQTNWDSTPTLNNRIWHSGNLANPITTTTDYQTPSGFKLRAVVGPQVNGDVWLSTPAYGTGQGDNRTHFGYLIDSTSQTYVNYIRGARTVMEGTFAAGAQPTINSYAAMITASYAGAGSIFGLTLNCLQDTGTAIAFCKNGTQSTAGASQGSITVTASAVQYNTTSDLRVKTNVKPSAFASEKLMQIDVISYDMKESGDHVEYGFGAQQLHKVVDNAVTPGNEGEIEKPDDIWQVDNSKVVPLLTKALQETNIALANAMKLIEELRTEVNDLKANKA